MAWADLLAMFAFPGLNATFMSKTAEAFCPVMEEFSTELTA